jgi:hypothetical protein
MSIIFKMEDLQLDNDSLSYEFNENDNLPMDDESSYDINYLNSPNRVKITLTRTLKNGNMVFASIKGSNVPIVIEENRKLSGTEEYELLKEFSKHIHLKFEQFLHNNKGWLIDITPYNENELFKCFNMNRMN